MDTLYFREMQGKNLPLQGQTVLLLVLLCAGCGKKNADHNISYADTPQSFALSTPIREASGIAASIRNPGYLWTEEDSNNPPQVYLLKKDATAFSTVYIKNAVNRDWEDIALAAGPVDGKNYLYIGEIGDNDAQYAECAFYRMEEPAAGMDTVRVYDKIRFKYEDGPRDVEAFVVDNSSKNIYLFSKRDFPSRVYRLSWPYGSDSLHTAKFIGTLSISGLTSAAVSSNGNELILKTYSALYYAKRNQGESLEAVFRHSFTQLSYEREPQGEAVCFAADSSGFYTLSETGNSMEQYLYFYSRK